MNTVIRSPITKLLAVLLCIVSVSMGAYTVASNLSNNIGYAFEANYADSWKAQQYRDEAVRRIFDMLDTGNIDYRMLEDYRVEYYAKSGDRIISNSVHVDKEYFEQSDVYLIFQSTQNSYESYGHPASYRYSMMSSLDSAELYIKLNDDYIAEQQALWTQQAGKMEHVLNTALIWMILGIAAAIYLAWTAGKRKEDEEVHMLLVDRLFVEFDAAIVAGALIGGGMLVVLMTAAIFHNVIPQELLNKLIAVTAGASAALSLAFILSMIRNLKNRTFLERSLIWKIIRLAWKIIKWCFKTAGAILCWMWNLVKRVVNWIKENLRKIKHGIFEMLSKNFSGRKVIGVLLGYSAALFFVTVFFVMGMYEGGILSFAAFLMIVGGIVGMCIFTAKRIRGFDKIVQGIAEIRAGNLDYKITDCPDGIMQKLAENINDISDGLSASVEREVKAERMKSELITNVSHDLKTPLTSIINYTDLLSKENLKPEEANDYVAIIRQKSERLKNLTSDLFDISKVQSGNESVNPERIDINLLIKQSLAEMDEAVSTSGLEFKTTCPDHEIFVMADGKKMSRVFENLLVNILKYSLKGTRVYIQVKQEEGSVHISFKNIANYSMDFDDMEIMERFVRGDASRTTEGSGLGLAIAQSYTAACGGQLNVCTDGDLFKAEIIFTVVA